MYLYLYIIILCSMFINVKGNICPINVCGKYEKYTDCWFNRLKAFDTCIIQINDFKNINKCVNSTSNILLNNQTLYNVDSLYNCNENIKIQNYEEYLKSGNCFYKIKDKIKNNGNNFNNKILNCFNFPISKTDPKCSKNICKTYEEYSQCWHLKITEFNYCIMSINKYNKYIKECTDMYGSSLIDYDKNINNYYDISNPYIFKKCQNTYNINIKNDKYYVPFLYVANCFNDKIKLRKNNINIYKLINNNNISCFDIENVK